MRRGISSALLSLPLLLMGTAPAWADDRFLGKWTDSAPKNNPMGPLDITSDKITVGKVTYEVTQAGPFGEGVLYTVNGLNRKTDPNGCGPTKKLSHIIVRPKPTISNATYSAIVVTFYAAPEAPKPDTLNEMAVCGEHPFGRKE
ncbi:hypothetical protein FBZ87_102516 [Nitrospirillum amazonense]|uniref:DUF2147 domain-containing protein n=1 Tax=Nitrospirillum amazonense TaxID=28077 RepID=A0A560KA30_9PROT|nr:hypothetical protein [Nitrospirillum amazonense]TWB80092.1 hypothetical protein FBZ87_102516 [Nitrospirillum amazonense]